MTDMTPTRLKRVSKVPNRFSSEQSRIKITSSPGETIINYNDNTVSTTHNLTPINKPIKLKTPTNEPFKIKLPIKRTASLTKESSSISAKKYNSKKIKEQSSTISEHNPDSFPDSHDINQTKDVIRNDYKIKPKTIKVKELKYPANDNITNNDSSTKKSNVITPKILLPSPPSSQTSPNLINSSSLPSPSTSSNNISQKELDETRLKTQGKSRKEKDESSFQLERSSIKSVSLSSNASLLKKVKRDDRQEHEKHVEDDNNDDDDNDDDEGDNIQNLSHQNDSGMEIEVSQVASDNGIRCPCGVNDDLGVMMECEKCHLWQHGHCINVATEEDAYDGYYCAFCTMPKEKIRESLQALKQSDEFESKFNTLLESQRRKYRSPSSNGDNESIIDEAKSSLFTLVELQRASIDIQRVYTSLMAKWKLYKTSNYISEIRIYQNPFWGHDGSKSPRDNNNLYFVDNCKANLKTNIIIMIKRLETRAMLIQQQMRLHELESQSENTQNFETLSTINRTLRIIKEGISQIRVKLPELQSTEQQHHKQ